MTALNLNQVFDALEDALRGIGLDADEVLLTGDFRGPVLDVHVSDFGRLLVDLAAGGQVELAELIANSAQTLMTDGRAVIRLEGLTNASLR